MKYLCDIFLYFNFILALGAGLLWYGVYHFLKIETSADHSQVLFYTLFIGTSTFLGYNLVCMISAWRTPVKSQKDLFFIQNKKLLFVLCLVAIICNIVFTLHLRWEDILFFIGLFVVLLIYENRIKYFAGLRAYPFLKTPIIVSVWILSCVVHPMFLLHQYHVLLIIMIAGRILLVSIIFDEKDITYDRLCGVKTIANSLSTKDLFVLKMGLYILMSVIFIYLFRSKYFLMGVLLLLYHFLIIFIPKINTKHKYEYYFADLSPLLIGLFLEGYSYAI